jgi:hypothetical protein
MNIRLFFKIVFINVALILVVAIIGSIVLRYGFSDNNVQISNDKKLYDSSTVRATYPVYEDISIEDAVNIFTDYAGPGITYQPFTGWSRDNYQGESVNVIGEHRVRNSVNHKVDNSIWFFGGSTMWGTGSIDAQTIPSIFAKKTGEKVLNLGESSYSSFQEFVDLSVLLAQGFTPKKVVFYDGVNDSYYCNTNNKQFPSHARVEKWTQVISEYPKLVQKYEKLKNQVKTNTYEDSIKTNIRDVYEYIVSPYKVAYQLYFSGKIIGRINNQKSNPFNIDIPMEEYTKKSKYKNCDTNKEKAKEAAEMTVNTWLLVHDLLKSRNIKFYVFLQPTSQISKGKVNLDYLIDVEKQIIVDTEDSFIAQYGAIKKEWSLKCELHDACASFYDISTIFDNLDENIYVDAAHVGRNGNAIIAEKIKEALGF